MLSYISSKEILKAATEVLRNVRAVGTSQVFSKIPKCFLYNSTIHEEQIFSVPFINNKDIAIAIVLTRNWCDFTSEDQFFINITIDRMSINRHLLQK